MKRILGIETSCDDTAVAILDAQAGLLAHKVHSQLDQHRQYGGVVPELASRDHLAHLLPLTQGILAQLSMRPEEIDGVAYTKGPGLVGALMVGASFARSLAWAMKKPSVGVHHLEAHLLAPMLERDQPTYPFLVLLVSGGHTQLIDVKTHGDYQLLGETLDDAVGEAFDKTAKLMNLAYPGGPEIERLAKQGDPNRWTFPRPMANRKGLEMSFSGLKTFALRTWEQSPQDQQARCDLARAFEDAVCDTLLIKVKRAWEKTDRRRLVVAGGVAANRRLREQLKRFAISKGIQLFYPRPAFCTDNAAMVAYAGLQRLLKGESDPLHIQVRARWPIHELTNEQYE